MGAFLDRLQSAGPPEAWRRLPAEAATRLEAFAQASPLYARLLEQHPGWALWLEDPRNLREEFRFQALLGEWENFRAAHDNVAREAPGYLGVLRHFRRKMSLRIAYRDVAGTATSVVIVEDLTRLAEFCLRECYFIATAQWTRRLGEPWDETASRRARFCILGLGKLGGRELNFSSDIDLIYVYEGEGRTRRDGQPTHTTNDEFFHRVGESITQMLNERDPHGFLFRADLRLRPGGAMAPLVPSIEAVEHYYAATGQIWERLALLKARPVAGDLAVGAELLENLHSFRYPRHAPPSLLAEIAGMKLRTEREVVGADALERNVKSGFGGIREIEFFVQAMQLLHAGRFPFLQTHSTLDALRQLVRYELLGEADATFLEKAYWFLRRVEHRIQMAEEQQTHELPADPGQRDRLARSLGFAALHAFDGELQRTRTRVREIYSSLFRDAAPGAAEAMDPWWSFFADGKSSPALQARLHAWFGDGADAARDLRLFVRESDTKPLLRDQVQRFADLVPALDRVLPRLARPRETLARISAFGERYGSRSQFLATCTLNPQFFEVLALLFDRSRFIHELLSRHPEIFDEILRPEVLRQRKDVAVRMRELAEHRGGVNDDFTAWLWLYTRAEQVRAAAGQLLGFLEDDEVEQALTELAEAVVLDIVRRVRPHPPVLVVALGTFGGGELTFGSDLDLLFVGDDSAIMANERAIREIRSALSGGAGREPTFAVDLRLRPHGDAGPVVPGIAAFRAYFKNSAQLWERQALTRARVIGGPAATAAAWRELADEIVYGRGLTGDEAAELWRMRLRVQNERDVVHPRERAFKTGAGGLIDVEFALQLLQLRHGAEHVAIRSPSTVAGWRALAAERLVEPGIVEAILSHYRHLQRIEWCLRRDHNRAVTVMPEPGPELQALARWLGAPSADEFWQLHLDRMRETRALVGAALRGLLTSTTLETGR